MVLPPHLPGDGKSPGQDSLPTPPAKGVGGERAATRLFSWDAQGAQWHRCQSIYSRCLTLYTANVYKYEGGQKTCVICVTKRMLTSKDYFITFDILILRVF